MLRNFYFFVFLVCFSCFDTVFSLNAQELKESDSASVISYEDKIQLKLNIDSQIENYFISDRDGVNTVQLALNSELRLSLLLDYKIVSLMYSFSPAFLPGNDDDAQKGKSSLKDLTFRLFPGQFVQEVKYKKMKGFYLANTADLIPALDTTAFYLQFPDLENKFYGGSTAYILNPKFSLENLAYQREWQKFSAGSFVPRLSYSYSEFSNNFGDFVNKENDYDLSLDLAYYYNWVVTDRINISPYAYAGLGGRIENYRATGEQMNETENDAFLTHTYGGGLQLGYNTTSFLMGIKGTYASFSYQRESTAKNDSWYGLVYVGYRIDFPEKLKRFISKK